MLHPKYLMVPRSLRRAYLLPLACVGLLTLLATATLLSTGALRDWLTVLLLGSIEGLTEFLPISSTAHLLIAAHLFQFQHGVHGTFAIFIQFGAVLAVIGYYGRALTAQARALPSSATIRNFWMGIILAFIPPAVVGLLFYNVIKTVLFTSPTLIAQSLLFGGIVLVAVEHMRHRPSIVHRLEEVHNGQAIAIGLAQVFALAPGVSRSAASIIGGMQAGLDRRTATAFSFYVSIPTLGGAIVVDLLSSWHLITAGDIPWLVGGALVSFVVAWMCIHWFIQYIANHSFMVFGVYRIVIGLIILLFIHYGVL